MSEIVINLERTFVSRSGFGSHFVQHTENTLVLPEDYLATSLKEDAKILSSSDVDVIIHDSTQVMTWNNLISKTVNAVTKSISDMSGNGQYNGSYERLVELAKVDVDFDSRFNKMFVCRGTKRFNVRNDRHIRTMVTMAALEGQGILTIQIQWLGLCVVVTAKLMHSTSTWLVPSIFQLISSVDIVSCCSLCIPYSFLTCTLRVFFCLVAWSYGCSIELLYVFYFILNRLVACIIQLQCRIPPCCPSVYWITYFSNISSTSHTQISHNCSGRQSIQKCDKACVY